VNGDKGRAKPHGSHAVRTLPQNPVCGYGCSGCFTGRAARLLDRRAAPYMRKGETRI
jgi:hypothetical protein